MSSARKPDEKKPDHPVTGDGAFEIQLMKPVRPQSAHPSDGLGSREETGEFSREEPFKGIYATREGMKFREREASAIARAFWKKVIGGILATLFLVVVGIYVSFNYSPSTQRWMRRHIKELQAVKVPEALAPLVKSPLEYWEKKFSRQDAPGGSQSAQKPWSEMDCKFLIQEALTRKLKQTLDAEGTYLLLACHLNNDTPEAALRTLGETQIASAPAPKWKNTPEQLMAAEVRFRIHSLHFQAPPRIPTCVQWKATPACLMRFVGQARLPLQTKQEGVFPILDKAIPKQLPRVKVWLYWAAALNALKEGRGRDGESHLEAATGLLKKINDPFLEKEVFRSRVRNAWLLRDTQLMNRVWSQRPERRIKEDKLGYLDSELMHKILLESPATAGESVAQFLNQTESYQRFRFDPYFIRWAVEQAIEAKKMNEAWQYLDHVVDQDTERQTEWIDLLRVRILLARGQGLEALQKIQSIERYAQKSALLTHLRGLALLHGFTSKPYRMKAAKEFQNAINNGSRGPSYFAMIVAFLEAREEVKAEVTLTYWQKETVKGIDKAWVVLARSLIRYRNGDIEASVKMWQELASQYPEMIFVRKLEQSVRSDPKSFENQLFKELLYVFPTSSPIGPLVDLSQKS